MIVEIHGLELFGRHGVGETERRDGQSFVFDVTIELPEPTGDSVDATVDYRRVRDLVRAVSDGRAYELLESLAVATAEAIVRGVPVDAVTVRVRKPGIAWAEWTAATATRRAPAT